MLRKTAREIAIGYRGVVTTLSWVAAGIIMAIMLLTVTDVVARYVFGSPIVAVYEVVQVMLVGVVYLGLAYVQRVKGHVRVDAVTTWLPEGGQLSLNAFGYAVGALLMALVTWRSGIMAWEAWVTQDYTPGLIKVPTWPGRSLIPLGAGLLCIQLIVDVVDTLRSLAGESK